MKPRHHVAQVDSVEHRRRSIEILIDQGNLARAEEWLRELIAVTPQDAWPATMLALVMVDRGRLRDAEVVARSSLAQHPNSPLAHFAVATTLQRRGRLQEARRSLGAAIHLDPANPRLFAEGALIELNAGNWSTAIEAADAGLSLDPAHRLCLQLRALALSYSGRHDEAQDVALSALTLAPASSATHEVAARAALHRGSIPRALEGFREALRLDPASRFAREGLVEATKGQSRAYLTRLRLRQWWHQHSQRGKALILLAVLVAIGAIGNVAQYVGGGEQGLPYQLVVNVFATVLFGGAILYVLAGSAATVRLRRAREGRTLLLADERLLVDIYVGIAVGVVALMVISLFAASQAFWAAASMLALALPVRRVLNTAQGAPRRFCEAIVVAAAFLLATTYVFLLPRSFMQPYPDAGLAAILGALLLNLMAWYLSPLLPRAE
jgi:tetratricopeptide (TPR) repeat protein